MILLKSLMLWGIGAVPALIGLYPWATLTPSFATAECPLGLEEKLSTLQMLWGLPVANWAGWLNPVRYSDVKPVFKPMALTP